MANLNIKYSSFVPKNNEIWSLVKLSRLAHRAITKMRQQAGLCWRKARPEEHLMDSLQFYHLNLDRLSFVVVA
jgi:hypothetical protein